jgi:hypothetical protein
LSIDLGTQMLGYFATVSSLFTDLLSANTNLRLICSIHIKRTQMLALSTVSYSVFLPASLQAAYSTRAGLLQFANTFRY